MNEILFKNKSHPITWQSFFPPNKTVSIFCCSVDARLNLIRRPIKLPFFINIDGLSCAKSNFSPLNAYLKQELFTVVHSLTRSVFSLSLNLGQNLVNLENRWFDYNRSFHLSVLWREPIEEMLNTSSWWLPLVNHHQLLHSFRNWCAFKKYHIAYLTYSALRSRPWRYNKDLCQF